MKKQLKMIALGVGLSAIFLATVLYAATEVPDFIRLENKAYKKHKYGIVEFSHKKHAEEYAKAHPDFYKNGCGECHHDDQNKPLSSLKAGDDVQDCMACHKKIGEMPSKEKKAMRKAKLKKAEQKKKKLEYHAEAFHYNCRDCHKAYNKKNKLKSKNPKATPTTCKKCHPKK